LLIALAGAVVLAALAISGLLTPIPLLACCFVVGIGFALFLPAWQASISEQVGADAMPSAVLLYSLSSNAARSIGPAIGGAMVAAAGATRTFALNVLLYLPIIGAMALWKRRPRQLPATQDVLRSMLGGIRYALASTPTRNVLIRAWLGGVSLSAVSTLAPMIARDVLGGGAETYGLLLGSFGAGAVLFALTSSAFRHRWSAEAIVTAFTLATSLALIALALSRTLPLSCAAMLVMGGAWTITMSFYNIGVQTIAPDEVKARAVSLYQAIAAAGLVVGSVVWGQITALFGVLAALTVGAMFALMIAFAGLWAPLPGAAEAADLPQQD
jgi:predicted MFS family arabinose efflux permease